MSLTKIPNTKFADKVLLEASAVAAIAATTTIPLGTMDGDYKVEKFEIEAAGGYTSNGSAYYDISLQTKPKTFTATAATDVCNATAHGLLTGDAVQVTNSGGGLPAGLAISTTYWVIKVDADNFKLATSLANANAGTAIDITTAGTGTQSFAKVLAMYSLITVTGNGDLTDLVFAPATLMNRPYGQSGDQINAVLTKFSTAANVGAGSRFVAHLKQLTNS